MLYGGLYVPSLFTEKLVPLKKMSKTPISILQELTVKKKQSLPEYHIGSCNAPGASFKCTVKINNVLTTCGYGRSKKEAKQNSAQKALRIIRSTNETRIQTPQTNYNQESFYNYVGTLNEYASTNGISQPTYSDDNADGRFVTYCRFLKWKTVGYGLNKKESKQDAARKMLSRVKPGNITTVTEHMENLRFEESDENDWPVPKTHSAHTSCDSLSTNEASSSYIRKTPPVKLKKNATLEELRCEMEKSGYEFTIETFHSAPFNMMMKITGTNAILVGKGNTREEAMIDLFETAVQTFCQDSWAEADGAGGYL